MDRRDVLKAIPLSALASALPADAQSTRKVVGFLSGASAGPYAPLVAAFKQGLLETGYSEGSNLTLDERFAEGRIDRLPGLARELVERRVDVIVTSAPTSAALAAKAATTEIPIVFAIGADPVKLGLVASMNQPAGNITGVSSMFNLFVSKRVEILCELVPGATALGVLVNPENPSAVPDTSEVLRAAEALGRSAHVVHTRAEHDFEPAFSEFRRRGVGALIVVPDPLFSNRRDLLVRIANEARIPASYSFREYVVAGGLMSYGASFAETHRQAGVYAGRILNGEKVGDLPVLQPTNFELVLNLKTARELGVEVPANILVLATDIIE